MNDIGGNSAQHLIHVGKTCGNAEAFTQLLGHERFAIAKCDNFTIRNATDSLEMLVRDLAATDERDPQGARG